MAALDLPYDEFDPPIVGLVRALNELPGIETIGSCAGHEEPEGGQWPADSWYVTFGLQPADPNAPVAVPGDEAWLSLEWLSWMVSNNCRNRAVDLVPTAAPPYLNRPGRMLRFAIEGSREGKSGMEPSELAESIERLAAEYYVFAEDAATWDDDDA